MDKENKSKKKVDGDPSLPVRAKTKLKDIWAEFKKIIWPDRKTLIKHTVNVIIVCGIIGGIIVVMDVAFSNLYGLFIGVFR